MNVTVQKGHDFSTGNVTRAALNAGAIPTIALSGTVGTSEIANGAITNLKVNDSADIAVSKLALGADKLIIGDANGKASALSPAAQFQHGNTGMGNEFDTNCGLLVDTGDKYEVLSTDVSAVGGQIELTKFRADDDSPFWLKLNVANGTLKGSHMSTDFYDDLSLTKSSSGKLEVKDNGIHHQKLYAYKDSNGDPKSGFLTYGAGGAAYVVQASGANQLAVTSAANGNPELRTFDKEIDLGHFTSENQWKRVAHGLTNPSGSSAVCPTSVSFYLECTNHDNAHNYAVGDRIYTPLDRNDNDNNGFFCSADKTHVIVAVQTASGIELPKKCGGNTSVLDADGNPTGNTHEGTDGPANFEYTTYKDDFKLIVRVCG